MIVERELPSDFDKKYELTDADFKHLSALVYKLTGIVLREEKRPLVYARLSKRLRSLNLDSFTEYRKYLEGNRGEEEVSFLINAITTNLTHFFREIHHFEHIRDVFIPEFLEAYKRNPASENKRLRIWSAACSSGEEPYSIAMTLAAHLPAGFDVKILATDIDTNMVAKGMSGHYRDSKGIPREYLSSFCEEKSDGSVQMGEKIRSMITFKPLNFLHEWPMKGPFNLIFCRNVVIYFDRDTQQRLFSRIAGLMNPGAWLYIGHSESLFKVNQEFMLMGRTIYRRIGQ